MDRIGTITLENVLPSVFVGENIQKSGIWNCNVTFSRGEDYLVEAASGTGKSSLCAYLFGSRTDYEGEILFDSRNIKDFKIPGWQEIRRRHIAYLPQELSLFPELTALQNIRLKAELTGSVPNGQIEEWMHELGIDSRANYPVAKMSVGQQQRVAVIRAVCQPFDFILLDEPVSHLDEENNRIVARIVLEEARKQGASVIATSVGNQLMIPSPHIINL